MVWILQDFLASSGLFIILDVLVEAHQQELKQI